MSTSCHGLFVLSHNCLVPTCALCQQGPDVHSMPNVFNGGEQLTLLEAFTRTLSQRKAPKSPTEVLEKSRARSATYYARNREAILEHKKAYYQAKKAAGYKLPKIPTGVLAEILSRVCPRPDDRIVWEVDKAEKEAATTTEVAPEAPFSLLFS